MSSFDGVTSEADCLADAPDPYRSLMHYLHLFTIPLYTLALYVLIFKSPISLRGYRKYLIWHTIGNLVFEVYISIFMLPVPYLPHLVFRGAGILKYWNVSGVVQFYLLVSTLIHTGLSVMELFKYRFDAIICEETFNKKLLHNSVVFFWIIAVFIPVFAFFTTPLCLPTQRILKENLWKAHPESSIEIVCHTSVTPPPYIHYIFTPLMVLIVIAIITALTIIPYTTITILTKLKLLEKHLSMRTIELQKMLSISLFIQAAIHGFMLGIPMLTFVYAIVFSLKDNETAYVLLLVISFHGSMSTIAMIGFTKPIRDGVIGLLLSISLVNSSKISTSRSQIAEVTFDKPTSVLKNRNISI